MTRSMSTASSMGDSFWEVCTNTTTVENTFFLSMSGDTSPVAGFTQSKGTNDNIKAQYVARRVMSLHPNACGTSGFAALDH